MSSTGLRETSLDTVVTQSVKSTINIENSSTNGA